jgi:membrane-bound metal-dependent hydrolase YbcI (DUF457 family)
LLLKSTGLALSIWAFIAANVIIDVESGWHMLHLHYPVHRFCHTALGATLLIVPAAALTWLTFVVLARWVPTLTRARFAACLAGAALGAWSHVALDAIMHDDVRPFAPWSNANPLLDAVSLPALHQLCLASGLLGLVVIGIRALRRQSRPAK